MASIKERARWEHWFSKVEERMQRQKDSLSRVVLLLTEAIAALEEVADDNTDPEYARTRAKEALEKIKSPAAAVAVSEAESIKAEEPVEDPRRK